MIAAISTGAAVAVAAVAFSVGAVFGWKVRSAGARMDERMREDGLL